MVFMGHNETQLTPSPLTSLYPQDCEIRKITLPCEGSALILANGSNEQEEAKLLLRQNGLWVCKI